MEESEVKHFSNNFLKSSTCTELLFDKPKDLVDEY